MKTQRKAISVSWWFDLFTRVSYVFVFCPLGLSSTFGPLRAYEIGQVRVPLGPGANVIKDLDL
jgi:hypothetical protein